MPFSDRSLIFVSITLGGFLFLLSTKCSSSDHELPMGLMPIPKDNPISEEKVQLGRSLFFDKRLSRTNTVSCATCHVPKFAFADRVPISEGVNGGKTMRNTPSLLNVGYQPSVIAKHANVATFTRLGEASG